MADRPILAVGAGEPSLPSVLMVGQIFSLATMAFGMDMDEDDICTLLSTTMKALRGTAAR